MVNSFSYIMMIFFSSYVLVFYPLLQTYIAQDHILQLVLYEAATKFVDTARHKGFINKEMYEELEKKIRATEILCAVEIKHYQRIVYPISLSSDESYQIVNTFDVYDQEYIRDRLLKPKAPNNEPILYKMNHGDYLQITLYNTSPPLSLQLKKFLFFISISDPTVIYIPYGGMVLNEDY